MRSQQHFYESSAFIGTLCFMRCRCRMNLMQKQQPGAHYKRGPVSFTVQGERRYNPLGTPT